MILEFKATSIGGSAMVALGQVRTGTMWSNLGSSGIFKKFEAGRHPTLYLVLLSSMDCRYRERCLVNESLDSAVSDAANGGRDAQE